MICRRPVCVSDEGN